MPKKDKVQAIYEKDSKRYRRYSIGENKMGIVGTIYLPKDKDAPEEVQVVFSDPDDE